VVSTNKRAADARRVPDAEALLDRRYFVLDPEHLAAFHAPWMRWRVRIRV
jgi:hypothetical protein